MKTKLLALVFLAGTSVFAGPRFFFGVRAGYAPAPVAVYVPPPAPVVAYAPLAPAPGYWVRPPYARAYWVAPRYYRGRYYGGYWRH
jgi:hypothetical protein